MRDNLERDRGRERERFGFLLKKLKRAESKNQVKIESSKIFKGKKMNI